jgi:hypothetical protein
MDDDYKKYDGKLAHQGADHSAPYPVSRLAPAIELVDLAKEISQADHMLGNVATAKLRIIADQVKALQEEARSVLESVKTDQALHRAQCNFKRQPGKIYHLYRKDDESQYFSMLSPQDWGNSPPHTYVGSYRLEGDMSWTPLEQIDNQDDSQAMIQRLLAFK